MAAAIWIVAESPTAVETAAILLRPLGDVWSGRPTAGSWADAPAPDLLVLCAEDEPTGELRRLEQILAFVRRVAHPRRAPPPILFVVPDRGHPGADLARSLIDDRTVETVTPPLDPDTLARSAAALLTRPVLPPSLQERARRDFVTDRVALLYAGLDLPALRQAIDPRNAPTPVLLVGEQGTARGLLARYIHQLAEPVREAAVTLSAATLEAGLVERRLAEVTRGRRVSIYLAGLDRLDPAVQEELACALADGGWIGLESVRWIASVERVDRLIAPIRLLAWLRVELPALRARSDWPALVGGLAELWGAGSGRSVQIEDGALERLRSYGWPRNLRELEHVLTESLEACPESALRAEHVQLGPAAGPTMPTPPEEPASGKESEAEMEEPAAEVAPTPTEASRRVEVPADATNTDGAAPDGEGRAVREIGMGALVGPLAQEIHQPVLAIRTFANLLEELPDGESLRDRLSSLVEGDLARVESAMGRFEQFATLGDPKPSAVNVSAVVAAELERRRAHMAEEGLVILEELDREGPPAVADPDQLQFAIGALLDRALRMVPAGGDLYVGTFYLPADSLQAARQRLLIRFHSPEDVLVAPEGASGSERPLEVVMAQALIERMGGHFAVDSSGSQDNVILIDLPA